MDERTGETRCRVGRLTLYIHVYRSQLIFMNDFELGQILGAAFLALIVITALVSSGRRGWGRTIKQSAAWAAIFIVTIAGVGIWQDIQTNTEKAQAISA